MMQRMSAGPTVYQVMADIVLVAHFAFVLFVVFGGLLVVRWPCVWWLHAGAAAWGAAVEFADWTCPLTPLENWLRERAGYGGYQADFLARYLLPVLYPEGLTRPVQIGLGVLVIAINVLIYAWILRRRRTLKRGDRAQRSR